MTGRIRVLYVDDEPGLLQIARVFLERSSDLVVSVATSPEDALSGDDIRTMDVVVSDYQMPLMDGITFLKTVRQRYGSVPFILFTGRGREEVVIDAINHGVDFYVQKGGRPEVQFAELAHKIRQAVSRRETERRLRDSEQRLKDIIDFLPDPMFAIDRTGSVIAWNRAMTELTGVPASMILGKGDHEYAIPIHGTRQPLLVDLVNAPELTDTVRYERVDRHGSTITAVNELTLAGGRTIRALIKVGPLSNQQGEPVGAIELIRDISDTPRQEATLTRTREFLERIFLSIPIGIVVIDPSTHRIVDINPAAADMVGLPVERILGGRCDEFICQEVHGTCPIGGQDLTRENGHLYPRKGDGGVLPGRHHSRRLTLDGRDYILEIIDGIRGRERTNESMQENVTGSV